MKFTKIYLLLTTWSLLACQEEVFIDLAENPSTPVIEAVWTDNVGLNHVKIFTSKDYFESEEPIAITNAEVYIVNETSGSRIAFKYLPQTRSYLPVNNKVAKIGHQYQLNVLIGGNHYQAKGTTLEPPSLDSIAVEYKEERLFREEGYYLTLFGDIPFTSDNNYRIKIIRNDTLLNRRSDYLLFDETFGVPLTNRGLELNGFVFKKNDRVRVELYRLNRDAFNYLNELVNLLFNDGGLFSPPPQNPTSNISLVSGGGDVLGYFKTASVVSATVLIDPD